MIEFKLPAIGEGVVEGEIVRWLKQPGEAVAANEPLVEVMTDKASVEIPSPYAAVVKEHRAGEGEIAAVGDVIAVLNEGAAAQTAPSAPRPAPVPAPAPTPTPTPTPASVHSAPAATTAAVPTSSANGKVLATPAARALARESGIDLNSVPGERGRITKADILRAQRTPVVAPMPSRTPTQVPTAAPAASRSAPAPAQEADVIPFRGMRRRIAESMAKSYSTAVHYTYVEQVNMTKLVALRKHAKAAAAQEGVQLSYLPFIVKAVVRALKRFPIVNSTLDQAAGQIVLKKHYNIGVAAATKQGLMVPVVHAADKLSLLDIASEIQRVSEAAKNGKATLHELTGSTFTVSSLGLIGGVLATPIINYPEVGILGVHAIRKTPIVDENDKIVIGHMMNLSVSLDHRVVDGFEGASFLQEVVRYLEDPTLLLLAGI